MKGTDQVERALEDLADESGDLTRDVEGDTERMSRAYRDAAKDVDRASDKAARSVRKGFVDPAKESGAEAGREVGAEFASNLGESLAGGDISGLGRDTAAGLVSGFAGMGGALGPALAGVAAVFAGTFAAITAKAEESKARIEGMYEALTTGDTLASQALKESQVKAFLESLGDSADTLLDNYERLGVSLTDVAAALAGDAEARARVDDAVKAGTDSLFAQESAITVTGGKLDLAAASTDLFAQAQGTAKTETELAGAAVLANAEAYERLNTELDKAYRKTETYYRLLGRTTPTASAPEGVPLVIARPGGGNRQ